MNLESAQDAYARLLIHTGVNLQPDQCLRISAEIGHRTFVHRLVEAAYQAGAPYVQVEWQDPVVNRARLLHSQAAHLAYLPPYEVARHQTMLTEEWAVLALVGSEYPHIFEDVDSSVMRQVQVGRREKLKFWSQATMADRVAWSVAAVPTQAWACQIFPDREPEQALAQLWHWVLNTCRADRPDPVSTWAQHNRQLKHLCAYLMQQDVRTLHFLDLTPGPDSQPATDLRVGLTDLPNWEGGNSVTPAGTRFMANIPTEELFSTPHRQRVEGYVRTSKPFFPFEQEVRAAFFRFEAGEVVDFLATQGQTVLEQFFQIPGARNLGEVALVDVRSPINQSDILFYNTLFDENAVCHIAFGQAYPVGIQGGGGLSEAELLALGANQAQTHLDVMIGTPTMQVNGLCADGRTIPIMAGGQFLESVISSSPSMP